MRQCDLRKCEATAEGGRPTWDKGDKAGGGGTGPGLTPVNVLRVHSERQELSAGRGSSLI